MKTAVLIVLAALAAPAAAASVTQRIPAGDGGWDIATVDAATQRLFVGRGDGVLMVDLKSGVVSDHFVPGKRVHEAMVAPGTGLGLSTNGESNTATIFDAATGAVRAEVPTGIKPDAIAYDPASKTMWVMNPGDGSATIVDLAAGKSVGSISIGGSLEYAAVDGKGHLFVNVEDRNELVEIDIAARKVMRRTALDGCDGPTGLGLTARGVLIASCANGVAKLVDAASGKALGDIAIGPRPDAVIVDEARHRAFVPSGGDGTLTVVDIGADPPRRIAQIATQAGARTGAVDTITGKVYLPAARYASAVPGQRPKALPGSFAVLVVQP